MEFIDSSELILFASSSLAACRIFYFSLFFEAIYLIARCYDTRNLNSHKTMLKLLKPYVLRTLASFLIGSYIISFLQTASNTRRHFELGWGY